MNQQTLPNFQESEAFAVLRSVESHTSQKSLAQDIGYSVGKVNYILKALVQKGFVKRKKKEYEELQYELEMMRSNSL